MAPVQSRAGHSYGYCENANVLFIVPSPAENCRREGSSRKGRKDTPSKRSVGVGVPARSANVAYLLTPYITLQIKSKLLLNSSSYLQFPSTNYYSNGIYILRCYTISYISQVQVHQLSEALRFFADRVRNAWRTDD